MKHKVGLERNLASCSDLLAVRFFCAHRGADAVVDTAELSVIDRPHTSSGDVWTGFHSAAEFKLVLLPWWTIKAIFYILNPSVLVPLSLHLFFSSILFIFADCFYYTDMPPPSDIVKVAIEWPGANAQLIEMDQVCATFSSTNDHVTRQQLIFWFTCRNELCLQ